VIVSVWLIPMIIKQAWRHLELWNYGQNSGSCLASTYGRVHSIWRSCPECFVSVVFRIHSP
jgi:hypothetical protein